MTKPKTFEDWWNEFEVFPEPYARKAWNAAREAPMAESAALRLEASALRKKVEDLLAHAREVEDQRNDLQERWSYEYDEAQRLRKRLAEVEVELSHFRNRTQGAEAALSVVAGDDASKAEDLDALRTHFGISEGEDVVEGVKARFALTEESSGRAKKVDQDALANVIENSRLIGSQYDADRLAEKIVEWLEGRDG